MKIYIAIASVLLFFSLACEKEEKPITYELTTQINPKDGGIINPANGKFNSGEKINLKAITAEGYYFKTWTGDISSTENPIELTISSDKTITAIFEKIDSDNDGVPNDLDQCSDTPEGETVDEQGCSDTQKDSDEDGVLDSLDQCPETPNGETADENGCANTQKDSDGDGISDDLDTCSNTPRGENVDEQGCSDTQKDSDEDGVLDSLDQCPETPNGEIIDENGCATSQKDTDNDGITDNLDICSETQTGEDVDDQGCSEAQKDTDHDGVSNNLDQCPETPEGETVDENGCTISPKTYIPDDRFEERLIELGYDDVMDDYVLTSNISSIQEIVLSGPEDLTGIKAFVSLERLYISDGRDPTFSFNASDFPNLKILSIQYSWFKSITVDENSELERLVSGAQLETLSVTNSRIQYLSIDDFSNIGLALISDNSNLATFGGNLSKFNEVVLKNNAALKSISFWRTDIEKLNVVNNSHLENFDVSDSEIPLDFSSIPSLKKIILQTSMGEINVTSNNALEVLSITEMNVDKLDISNNNLLTNLSLDLVSPESACIKVNQEQLDNIPPDWSIIDSTVEFSLDCSD